MARYFECPIQCFSAAFDVLIKISESYRPQIPSDLAKSKHADKTKWIIKAKKVPLMMIILPSEVDDDG